MPPVKKETIEFEVVSNLEDHLKQLDQAYKAWEKLGISIGGINKEFDNSVKQLLDVGDAIEMINKQIGKQKVDFPKAGRMMVSSLSSGSKEADIFVRKLKELSAGSQNAEKILKNLSSSDYTIFDDDVTSIRDVKNDADKLLETLDEMATSGMDPKLLAKQRKSVDFITKRLKDQAKTGITNDKILKGYLKVLQKSKNISEAQKNAFKNTWQFQKLGYGEQAKTLQAQIQMWRQTDGTLSSTMKILKAQAQIVKLKAMQKIGRGVEGAKGAFKAVTSTLAKIPGMGMVAGAGIGALIEMFTAADKRVKGLQRDVIGLSMSIGDFSKDSVGKTNQLILANQNLGKELSVNEQTIMDWEKGLRTAGFTMDFAGEKAQEGLKDVSALATKYDMSFEQMTDVTGTLREELGNSLGKSTTQLTALEGAAKASGMTMSRFLAKVTNAASGLAIYGTKISGIGNLMVNLKKKMGLPEAEAEKMTDKFISGFKDMEWTQKSLILQNSEFSKSINGNLTDFSKAMGMFNAKTGKATDEAKNLFDQFKTGQIDQIRLLERADPSKWVQTQLEFAFKAFKVEKDTSLSELATKLSDTGTREELGKIAGLDAEMMRWIQKMVVEQANTAKATNKQVSVSEMLAGFSDKYGSKADDAAKAAQIEDDKRIKKQTRPITDAMEQLFERWGTRVYLSILKFFNWFVKHSPWSTDQEKTDARFQDVSIALQEKMVDLNQQLGTAQGDDRDKIQKQLDEVQKDSATLEKMKGAGNLGEDWIYNLEQATELEKDITKQKQYQRALGVKESELGKGKYIEGLEAKRAKFKSWAKDKEKQALTTSAAVPAAKDVEIKTSGYLPTKVSAGDMFIDKRSMARFKAGPKGAAIPSLAAAGAGGNVINDNRTINIIVNQRDANAIAQIVRQEMYTDKMAR